VRILVAMDSFKGSLAAKEACEAAARGIRSVLPEAEIETLPMADGGEGTLDAVLGSADAEWIVADVTGPLPEMTVRAGLAWLEERGPGAFVEMATASGLELLGADQLDPLRATTFGTGELLSRAFARGAHKVWLAIGGSATVDGGTGAARALGWRFLDRSGAEVGHGGGELERIARIVRPSKGAQERAEELPAGGAALEVLCDVDNPLLGARGAARVFGPQKGATPEVVERLEAGLTNLADVIERDLGRDVREARGGGAAGGLGAGAIAFLDATLVSGVDAVADAVGLDDALAGAHWVVTGEGRLDEQSLNGKVVSGVVARARRVGCRAAVLAGTIALDGDAAARAGIEAMEPAAPAVMPLEEALARGAELVEAAAERLARRWRDAG
jgi:glycerate 2-kinase